MIWGPISNGVKFISLYINFLNNYPFLVKLFDIIDTIVNVEFYEFPILEMTREVVGDCLRRHARTRTDGRTDGQGWAAEDLTV